MGIAKVGDKIIYAGGEVWNTLAYTEIIQYDLTSGDIEVVGYLPKAMFSVASVYYKNTFYIHGGGD